jgi:hypothetical protein
MTPVEGTVLDKLNEINKKLDFLIKDDHLSCTRPEFVWSIEYLEQNVVIKYNYDRDFSRFIKSMNILCWDKYSNSWIAHSDSSDTIYSLICRQFPEWRCIDKR